MVLHDGHSQYYQVKGPDYVTYQQDFDCAIRKGLFISSRIELASGVGGLAVYSSIDDGIRYVNSALHIVYQPNKIDILAT